MEPPEIVIVGPGRLGRTVAGVLLSAGLAVQLCGRGEDIPVAAITWLCVPDAAIAAAAARVPPGGVLLHASGATDLDVLRPRTPVGSLHPLMTFPGPEVATPVMAGLPAAVAGDPAARRAAERLAAVMGWRTFEVTGDRALYHAAAVIAGNYATTLLAVAAEVLAAAGVAAEEAPGLLAPLALASLKNAAIAQPVRALTGPAARGDEAVISKHRAALASVPGSASAVYDAMLLATQALLRAEKDQN
ncbi:MAG: putative short-subunit dehydrogenase-like oxidoreductase (DUF2520 family) [Myxococcota bacterium]